jgi:hypothetical protein
MNASWYHIGGATATTVVVVSLGCATPGRDLDDASVRAMLNLLMPSRIEIVEPFTRVRSFDESATPNGIEVLIRAVNALEDPGLMIAGRVRIELFTYVPASGQNKGPRVEQWDVDLATEKHQQDHWNSMTQMYEFRLALHPEALPVADAYVLAVSYVSPLGDQHSDECVLPRRPTHGGAIERRPAGG